MKALLIIDMQKISFTTQTPRYDTDGVVKRINQLSEHFRENGEKVIFIQHDGTKDGYCKPNTLDWEILDELVIKESDIVISKIVNDSFYKSDLKEYLDSNNINDLIITGCATDFCVDSTIKSALNLDYDITVISDCHTTADRFDFKSVNLIKYYNWIWSEMLPTRSKINIITKKEYING
jgi:nicotinamidase-related amidase